MLRNASLFIQRLSPTQPNSRPRGFIRSKVASYSFVASAVFINAAQAAVQIEVIGREELVVSPQNVRCQNGMLLDSPLRPMRRSDGTIVAFATHFSNWYLEGNDLESLKPVCSSAASGKEDPRPEAVDDRYWIQALSAQPDGTTIALASHEYLGIRHPGQCSISPSRERPYPCWFSSIIQLESRNEGRTFSTPKKNRIVATPQITYDRNNGSRLGFLTASNIVSDGDWLYSLIYVDGYKTQETGTCLFRASAKERPMRWSAWNGLDFNTDVSEPITDQARDVAPGCKTLTLGNQNRALVRLRETGQWIAIGLDRETRGAGRAGVFFSESKDLVNWSSRKLGMEVQIDFKAPECAAVYKYPTIVDHNAPGINFDTVGSQAYIYLVKVVLKACKPVERQLVRFQIKISNAR